MAAQGLHLYGVLPVPDFWDRLVKVAALIALLFLAWDVFAAPLDATSIRAQRYRVLAQREWASIYGLDGPVAILAGQVHQESRWNPNAKSPVGAIGLTQFMPATARDMPRFDAELSPVMPTDPRWSLRAQAVYMRWLARSIKGARDECEDWAFALAAYNGGLGWVNRRRARADDPSVCLGGACLINPGVSPASQRENEKYPVHIFALADMYYHAGWDSKVCRN